MDETTAMDRPLEREAIRTRELAALVGKIVRLRLGIIAVVSLFIAAMVAIDGLSSRSAYLGLLLIPLAAIAFFDYRRIDRYRSASVPYDLALIASLQTLVICLSGGAESPLIFVYFMVGIGTGIALGATRRAYFVIGYVSFLIWFVAALGFAGYIPRTVPELLDLGPGHIDRKLYVVATVAILNVVVFAAFRVGTMIYNTVGRMLDDAIGARQSALEALQGRNAELLHLSSAIAHELKNPLASVQGLVQLLERGDKNSAQRLEVLAREVGRMRDTLDELLNFTRPLGELSVERIDTQAMMKELTSLHEGLTESRKIEVVMPRHDSAPIAGDRRKMQQLLVNLFQNAIEATPDGGRIEWIARDEGEKIAIGVEDNGTGIEGATLDRLGRGEGLTTKAKGSGIGLAVARTIAEQHGGKLVLENRDGGGCRAVCLLPKGART